MLQNSSTLWYFFYSKMYVMTHSSFLLLMAALQASPEASAPWTLIGAGTGAGTTALVLYFYRLRETQYAAERVAIAAVAAAVAEKSEARLSAIAQDMRAIVENNTAAMTRLTVLLEKEHHSGG